MRIPARAAGPLVAMAIAAASFGCIAPAAYAENATAAVISDDGGHVVVDVDLNGSAPVGDATEQADMKSSQGESVSDAEPDEARRAAIRETRHRVCTAPILKSIKEIHR